MGQTPAARRSILRSKLFGKEHENGIAHVKYENLTLLCVKQSCNLF